MYRSNRGSRGKDQKKSRAKHPPERADLEAGARYHVAKSKSRNKRKTWWRSRFLIISTATCNNREEVLIRKKQVWIERREERYYHYYYRYHSNPAPVPVPEFHQSV